MKYKEYQSLSKRTSADIGGEKLNLSHMVMGMNSEMYELEEAIKLRDIINISEELADIMWYVSNYCTFRNIDFEDTKPSILIQKTDTNSIIRLLYNTISKLHDIVKKNVAYDKPINTEYELVLLKTIVHYVEMLAYTKYIDLSEALDRNIKKLKLRFPDKFDRDMAINRNHFEERKILEN
jgi:NTP pyrophosphatase (non-canonical NTP hydrolase)